MLRRFPWSSLSSMILPIALVLILGLQTGAFYREIGASGRLVWHVNPQWFSDHFILIAFVTVGFVGPGLFGLVRKWWAHRDFDRFDEEGYLTYATVRDIRWTSSGKATVGITTIEGYELDLKNLPEIALRGRTEGDQLPIYVLPDAPKRAVWAGEIDPPEQHTLVPDYYDDNGLAWRDAQARHDMQLKKGAAEKWITDFVNRTIPDEVVEDALSRSRAREVDQSDTLPGQALHTKFVRLSFFDFFIIPFLLVHGGAFLSVGLGVSFSTDAPFLFGSIFAIVGLVEMGVLGFMIVRVLRKLMRRARLTANGVQKSALYLGSTGSNIRVNGVQRRALVLEIDGTRYQHGSFSPRKISHLQQGQSLEILQDRADPKVVFVQSL